VHPNSRALDRGEQRTGQTFAAVVSLHRGPACEANEPVGRAKLPSVQGHEFHTLLVQPLHRFSAAIDQQIGQREVRAVLGHPSHIVEILLARIGTEVSARALLGADLAHQLLDVGNAIVNGAHRAIGKASVAAALLLGSALKHDH